MTALDVIAGKAKWSAEQSDALVWLRELPDDSVDLVFTSPPYELARTYGIGEKMVGGQAWVDWMVAVVTAAAPKVKGLIAINCEGQTRGYRYSCVPMLLMADLHRAGFNLRKPPVFVRSAIPGGGGNKNQHADKGGSSDWLRNDWEPIICIARKGKLPWADTLACGHTPKYGPGGEMSNRLSTGQRVNQWGPVGSKNGGGKRFKHGQETDGDETPRPSHRIANGKGITGGKGQPIKTAEHQPRFRHDENGNVKGAHERDIVAIANPGNVIEEDRLGNVVRLKVGGGLMGHTLAHESEAPFPLELPAFFVKSFCPPDGICCDPFLGSGTTIDAAIQHGRRGIGCDVRQSQIDLTERRMRTVTGPLFA